LGTLAAGLFFAGDLFDATRITVQAIGVAAGLAWGFGAALVMYLVVDKLFGMRASPLHEQRGLDFTEHAEVGYPEFQQNKMFNPDALDASR